MILTQILEDSKANRAFVIEQLVAGSCVVLPTETVYGLAANAYNNRSIATIYNLKGRPHFNPLIVHASSWKSVAEMIIVTPEIEALAHAFWPGPMTIVANKKNKDDFALASAGLDTIAVRIPQHPLFQEILHNIAFPLAAPSANPSNYLSATNAHDVALGFSQPTLMKTDQETLYILNGGACAYGLESTIIDTTHPAGLCILREGPITAAALMQKGFSLIAPRQTEGIKAPGQLSRHYAPQFPLFIQRAYPREDQAWLAFGAQTHNHSNVTLNLSESGSLEEAASNLFTYLHQLNIAYLNPQRQFASVAVQSIPEEGIGMAILDRLSRASTPEFPLGKDSL